MRGKKVGENVIRNTLSPAIDEVKGVRTKRSRITIGMVRLVNVLVNYAPVKDSMNPIDHEVSEEEEEWNRGEDIKPTIVVDVIVDFSIAVLHAVCERSE